MSQRNPGRRGFYGEDDSGSDGGDGSDTTDDGGSGGSSDGGRSRSGIGSGVRGQPGADPSGDGGSGDDGGGGGTGGDGRSRSGIDSGVTGQPGTGGEGDDGGTADDGTADDGGRSRSGIGSGVRGQPGTDPSDDGSGGGTGGDGRSRSGIGSGVRGQPGADPSGDGGSGDDGQTSPPMGRAPPSQRGDVREPADRVPGGQPLGYSGDPNPTGGIGPDVPARARDEATDLRQQAADQWQGAVGPEDIMITYDDADQQLEPTLTESGVREITARDNPYADFEDVTVSEGADGFDVSLSDDARLDTAAAETEYSRDQLAIRDGSIIATGGAQQQQQGQEIQDLATPYEGTTATAGGDLGQTTDPTLQPGDLDQPGIGEAISNVVGETIDDPGGYVGGGAADFATYVGADLTRGSAQAIDSGTTERIADTETFVPSGAVDRLQDAGAFIAEGSGEQESGIAGAYQDAGGLQGIGETAAGGLTEAAYTPPKAASGLAEEAGVPGAGRVESGIETVQTGAVEPALSGALGDVPAGIAQAPGTLALASERGVQTGAVLADDPSRASDVATSAAGFAGLAGVGIASSVAERPARSVGSITGEVAVGSAAVRGLERGADAVRSFRTRRQASDTVDLEDITSERGAEGDLPQFETDPNAPTGEAVAEVRGRAENIPESVEGAVGSERALYHSTQADLGRRTDVSEGRSELPGLFTSPDASPLRLTEGAESSGVRVGVPNLTGTGDRIVAVPGRRIEGMPEEATGAGRAFDTDADAWQPDPETSGYQFLTEQADSDTGYVRPTGSRTTELEAIVAPGTTLQRTERLAVQTGGREVSLPGDRSMTLGGRTIPLDVYRFGDEADAGPTSGADLLDDSSTARQVADEIESSRARSSRRSETPIGGPAFVPSSSPESSGATTSTTVTGTSTTTAPTSASTSAPSVSELTGTSTGESSAPSLPFGSSTPGGGSDSGTPITPPPSSGGSGSGSDPTPGTGVPRVPEPSLDLDGDEESFGFGVAGDSEEEIASFFDPLSGELDSGDTDDSTLGW